MKPLLIVILAVAIAQSNPQSARITKVEKGDKRNWAVTIEKDGASENYFASCYFKEVTQLPDSVKISLVEQLLAGIDDTSHCYKPVEALSYRYKGRQNKAPQSTAYNAQVAALVLINYLALSSEAVVYSPFPVLYDKQRNKEITTASPELDAVIGKYQEWFKKIKRSGFKDYCLPLMDKRYEWYGSLLSKQRVFKEVPAWEKLYDCPVLAKEED